MFSTAEKTAKHTTALQRKAADTTFFRKAEGEHFFRSAEQGSFFHPAIQTKVSVSSPEDPQEKEAEAVADKVMAMPDQISLQPQQEEKNLSRKEEEEVQPFADAPAISCKEEEKELQAKRFPLVHRFPDQDAGFDDSAAATACAGCGADRKRLSLHTSDVLQCSGRGPPAGSPQFEQSLNSSKGGGSALPGDTRQVMESRFGADFSGVRIHTGTAAASMSGQIHAQAFTHGNDIYFNSGKFAPQTSEGGHLLAHELTHTIQQGASKTSVAPKKVIQVKTHPAGKSNGTPPTGLQRSEEASALQPSQKPELSNWQVNPAGQLNIGAAGSSSTEPKTDRKEAPQEEEMKGPGVQAFAQDHHPQAVAAREHTGSHRQTCTGTTASLSAKPQQQTSSLTYQQAITPAAPMMVHDRGPPSVTVQQKSQVQRSVLDDAISGMGSFAGCVAEVWPEDIKRCALSKVQRGAMLIPGYRALRVVLGEDPVTNERVARNGHNLIEAAFDIMPGGRLLHQKLNEMQKLDAAAAWIDTQIARVEGLVNGLFAAFRAFWNRLDATALTSPFETLSEGVNIVLNFIGRLVDFAVEAGSELLRMIKDWLLQQIVNFIREQTPAYPLLKVILGKDPITGEEVARNGTNILNALLELGGEEGVEQRKQMQETGSFQKVANYIDRGIAIFSGAYEQIVQGFRNIWSRVSIASLIDPVGTFRMIYNEFAEPVSKVWAFVREVGAAILRFIKEVLMRRLSAWARQQRGYPLITVLIGKDPFTDEVVPRNVENIIRGFMSLMEGGEEQFNQMKESGAIDRAAAEIDAAVARLNMTPAYIVQLFIDLWNSFSLNDLAHPIAAFQRIIARFGEPIMRLIAFVVEIIRIVIHVILQIMNFPFDLINNIIAKAMQAIDLIKADPIGFLKNLLKAVKQGFMQFFDNILTHLWNGLKEWFLGEVTAAGIPIPTDFSVVGIITWLLAVLDITMEKVWEKLEERIGRPKVDRIRQMISMAQRVAGAAGEAMDFIRDVQERGFMAVIVDKIKEQLSNVWDMVMEAVKSFVMNQIINRVVTRLLSMLDPTGIMAVINSAIAIYSAIQSFIRYLRELLEIVNSFVEGTLEIAQGNTKKAADFLEGALASGIPIVIGFLANQVGLNLSERLRDALEGVREWADRGLTWVIDRLVTIVERLVEMGRSAVRTVMGWLGLRKEFTMENGESHTLALAPSGTGAQLMIESTPMPLLTFIDQYLTQPGLSATKIAAANDARLYATTDVADVINQIKAVPEGTSTTALEAQLLDKMVVLTNKLRLLVGETLPLSNFVDLYNLEGAAGTFASMPKPTGDAFTADHIPQNGLFEVVMELGIFAPGSPMANHAAKRTDNGYAMNERNIRHEEGRTYGSAGRATKNSFRTRANNVMASTQTIQQKKSAIVELIKDDKNADIAAMQSVYGKDLDDEVWADVKNLPMTQADKETLRTRIKNQASAGLTLMNSQNLDALKV